MIYTVNTRFMYVTDQNVLMQHLLLHSIYTSREKVGEFKHEHALQRDETETTEFCSDAEVCVLKIL